MITRIEIDGFKSFRDFKLELAPFTLIAGANASGKSNLFDALMLLSSIAESDLRQAFARQRGEPEELFTQYGSDERAAHMHFAVEMFVNPLIRDDWGNESELAHLRLRYEIAIERRKTASGLEKLLVTREELRPIRPSEDGWLEKMVGKKNKHWRALKGKNTYKPYIYTDRKDGIPTIFVRQDGIRGGRPTPVKELERSVLSGISGTEFPHAFAAKKEMMSWRELHLQPNEMRRPSKMLGPTQLGPHGEHLAGMLQRLQEKDPDAMLRISRKLSRFVPSIRRIYVDKDEERKQFIIRAETTEGQRWSAAVLSEGTLRLLVLAALSEDEEWSGTLCLEEPENGVHPTRIKDTVALLADLVTDFREVPEAKAFRLRQVLANTHSPILLQEFFRAIKDDWFQGACYFAEIRPVADPKHKATWHRTRMLPVTLDEKEQIPGLTPPEEKISLLRVKDFLMYQKTPEPVK